MKLAFCKCNDTVYMYEKKINLVDLCYINKDTLSANEKLIPSQYRRRLSCASKLALSCAIKVVNDAQVIHNFDYLVFGSQHGELDHMVNILELISQKETLSPMKFSLSVHNAAAGLFTIINKLTQPATSIAAGCDTFLMSILDAVTYLDQHKDATVLVVIFDQALPKCYQNLDIQYDDAFALALILKSKAANDQSNLTLTINPYHKSQQKLNQQLPQKEFLNWYQGIKDYPSQLLTQYSLTQQFIWQVE